MNLYRSKLAATILLVLSLTSTTFAQQPATTQPQATPAPSPRGPDYVDFTGFKGKVFDVKHRDPRALILALSPLGSGFKGAAMQYSNEFRTIIVRDFPENIAAIEEALKRLDTPQPAQPDIELRMHILIASNVEGITTQVPNDLADVVRQMQATFNYKNYTNVATVVQRSSDGAWQTRLSGTAELSGRLVERDQPMTAQYHYQIPTLNLSAEPSGGHTVQLKDTEFSWNVPPPVGSASIRTSLNVRSGEKVVVGTATLGNKALILVLSVKANK